MAITINTKKVMDKDRGEGRVITRIRALSQDELPDSYLSGYPHCFQIHGVGITELVQSFFLDNALAAVSARPRTGLVIVPFHDTRRIIAQGQFLEEDDFQTILPIIEKAGLRLKDIQDDIDERERAWVGDKATESIVI